MAHGFLDDRPRRQTEFLPFRQEQERIRIQRGVIQILGIINGIAHTPTAFVHRHGIVGTHRASGFQQFVNQHQRWGLAHIIRLWLEGQPPEGDGLSLQPSPHEALQLVKQHPFLILIHGLYGTQHPHLIPIGFGSLYQCFHILGETRTSVSDTGIQELAPDAGIRTNAAPHHVDIRADQFA